MNKMVPHDLMRVQITKISVYFLYPLYFFYPPSYVGNDAGANPLFAKYSAARVQFVYYWHLETRRQFLSFLFLFLLRGQKKGPGFSIYCREIDATVTVYYCPCANQDELHLIKPVRNERTRRTRGSRGLLRLDRPPNEGCTVTGTGTARIGRCSHWRFRTVV